MGTLSEVHSRSGYTGNGRLMSTCSRDDQLVDKEALRNMYFTSTDLQQYLRRVRGVAISRQTISNHVSHRWCERTMSASCVTVCSQAS